MNLQSIIVLVTILIAVSAALIYTVKNHGKTGCSGCTGCCAVCKDCAHKK